MSKSVFAASDNFVQLVFRIFIRNSAFCDAVWDLRPQSIRSDNNESQIQVLFAKYTFFYRKRDLRPSSNSFLTSGHISALNVS